MAEKEKKEKKGRKEEPRQEKRGYIIAKDLKAAGTGTATAGGRLCEVGCRVCGRCRRHAMAGCSPGPRKRGI